MEPLIQEKKKTRALDRIYLGIEEAVKIDKWLAQVNQSSRGFLILTKTDLANWAIRAHRDDLNPKELSQIRLQHYDPIKHIQWVLPQIKEALTNGDTARVAVLQEELRGVELSVISKAVGVPNVDVSTPPTAKRKSKKIDSNSTPIDAEISVESARSNNDFS